MSLRVLIIVIGCLAALAAAGAMLSGHVQLGGIQLWVEQHRLTACVVFCLLYVIATATILPTAPCSIAAGLLFGAAGLPLAMLSATAAATAAFCVARYVCRKHIVRLIERRPLLRAMDRAITAQGWRVVCLARLSPLLPFNVQNYMFGVTEIGLRAYVLATVGGILPATSLWVYVGTQGQTSLAAAGPAAVLLPAVGLICTLLVVLLVGWAARRALLQVAAERL